MRRSAGILGVLVVLLVAASPAAAATRAGVAVVDATWHAGASGGQFTEDTGPTAEDGTIDPHLHNAKKRRSDGVATRTTVRALVVEDAQGDRVAVVTTDLYLPNDLLHRRAASLLAARPGTGITAENLAITASHNHNSHFTSTPGWGTAIFQDLVDVRFFAYMAQRIAAAVQKAGNDLVPVRIGGTTRAFDAVQGHTYGPKVGDDGTPAGQPYSHTTRRLSVVRFDDVSDPAKPKPLANWVIFGLHPEFTWGYDLINGDYTHAAARMVDRESGTVTLFSQRETGSSGPHKDERVHPASARREFEDNGFAQLDRGSRLIADAIRAGRDDIAKDTPQNPALHQPFQRDADVASAARRVAPPLTKTVTGVSNCNTYALFHGDPRVPVLGFPDCAGGAADVFTPLAPATAAIYDQAQAAGVPIPSTYSATAFTAVQETNAVHLMAFKLGGIGVTFNPSEQFTDTALNTESRLDRVAGIHTGFDWADLKTPAGRDWCVRGDADRWTCADPRDPRKDLEPIDDRTFRRFRAQVRNDARGWETDGQTLNGEAEPADPAKIKGNFTHEEDPGHGFALPLSVGMANDYLGYQPEYREHLSHDHYRKALAALGPHGSDFLATRLSRLAASLNGAPPPAAVPQDALAAVEGARAQATADVIGELGGNAAATYARTLPADGGVPKVEREPADVERFGAAHVTWIGGTTWEEVPEVTVERRVAGRWVPYGDQTGDVPVMVKFPAVADLATAKLGGFTWRWTAAFEAFASDIPQPDAGGTVRRATPRGSYRFSIRGVHRGAGGPKPYTLTSATFAVRPWSGLQAEGLRVESTGRVTFRIAPVDYPDSYQSPFRFIKAGKERFRYDPDDPSDDQLYCRLCTFRPWADRGRVVRARVRMGGRTVRARRLADGRWRTTARLRRGQRATVLPGGLRDTYGNTNGTRSATVKR